MKKKKKYEKPTIEFHHLQLKEEIANRCWSGKGGKLTWFYDISGKGYVSFQIDKTGQSGNGCSLNLMNVTYYDGEGNSSGVTADQLTELNNALAASNGNDGNNFAGEGVNFPTKPNPFWS